MAECDANYIRLLKLFPRLRRYYDDSSFQDSVVEFCISDLSNQRGQVNIQISVLESFKYTTTLKIEQRPKSGHWLENPAMEVRVYHDASTAEVVACRDHRNFEPVYRQPNPQMFHKDEKLQVNRFLGEWLSHCLAEGRCTEVPALVYS